MNLGTIKRKDGRTIGPARWRELQGLLKLCNLCHYWSRKHQISMARGSTMALETTRPRLRKSKTQPQMSIFEIKAERIQQHSQQGLENNFYVF
ncbi:unnamed protein product [Penicillium salamii]|uniref:Uncharacterized protein n=1 Tax=Penicillium salamii TaxID=1612424 RepID=A0A9W4NTK2_9EURO|nr:unnamed protein product [Penicillium salamii]CAG8414316.1 unnamed protein product [Penicillium salamii]CAG8419004.1 unnamed protein product [Penicillium salamii]CAG8419246.1 unnamed protein product [Penicillium salamii]